MRRKEVQTFEEFNAEAKVFVRTLKPAPIGATLVTLSGELGAGKTAFTKAAAEELGLTGLVTSPTFVLEKIYALPEGGAFSRLVHIDAYRLSSHVDLHTIGFEEVMEDPKNLVLLEWPEKVSPGLPTAAASLSFEVRPEGGRTISYG